MSCLVGLRFGSVGALGNDACRLATGADGARCTRRVLWAAWHRVGCTGRDCSQAVRVEDVSGAEAVKAGWECMLVDARNGCGGGADVGWLNVGGDDD